MNLRQYNNFSGNSFRSQKSLRIPIEPGIPVSIQTSSNDVIIQKFKNITGEDTMEAKYYLEENNWDLLSAIASLNGDAAWFEDNRHIYGVLNPPSAPSVAEGVIVPAGVEMVKPRAVAYSVDEMVAAGGGILSEEDSVRVPLLG